MIRIAVCDDDTDSIINNQTILKNCLSLQKAVAEIQTYNNGRMLLSDILEDHSYFDLLLLDIEMPGISGMEIVQAIKPELPNVKVIFITSHVKYAIDSFELAIFRYVLHTCHGIIKVRKSLLTVYEELGAEEFIFIERGCIINLIQITQIKNSSVCLKDGTVLPISRSHLQSVKMAVNTYWGKHI